MPQAGHVPSEYSAAGGCSISPDRTDVEGAAALVALAVLGLVERRRRRDQSLGIEKRFDG